MFRGVYCLHHQGNVRLLIVLMMEAVNTSETSANLYETTRHNIPEGCHIHTRRRENLKSLIVITNSLSSPHSTSLVRRNQKHALPEMNVMRADETEFSMQQKFIAHHKIFRLFLPKTSHTPFEMLVPSAGSGGKITVGKSRELSCRSRRRRQ
jgi:hypothetical protein